ncbi:hypothetical protein [Enterococcus rivorum]|uniref:DNA-directed RNA polymerase beta subunit n=1 Tax=Enterococcus rivorum TaxID=762845 RepID=A0A1E5L0J2_9ENTE|nr:hypothetical protein [Enterococcus rivorum]MBP2098887.1 DNA polymerase V [Enterococcus rivorum]OEH83636.1 hypothetical protein BCR26_09045 [Enterococcus rivorum]
MSELLNGYQDRKMAKWTGFYLSEHTSVIEKERQLKSQTNVKKDRLSMEEIDVVLYTARLYNKPVSIQKEELDAEGNYPEDVIGIIEGYDCLGIIVNGCKIDYDEIRHVEIKEFEKWSSL